MRDHLPILEQAFRRAAAYLDALPERRVYPSPQAIAGLAALDEPFPAAPSDPEASLRLLDEVAGPATVASAGGRYFGFVVGGSLPAALAADWLASAWDQSATMPVNSPAAARIEQVAAGWVLDCLDLPRESAVGFVTGASIGNLVALAAARRSLLLRQGWDVERDGLFGAPKLRVVASAEIHATLVKALGILGFGRDTVESVEVDAHGRIRPERLPALDARTIVCVQAGNVNSGAFDPFRAVAERTRAAGAWLHVDGAFGLWARAAPARAGLADGVDLADSWVTDAHKWLNAPYDCGLVICRHPEALVGAMSLTAAYMPSGEATPAKDLGPEFSRRARGIPVWAALRSLGRAGVADLVERTCRHAARLAAGLAQLGFEIHNEVVLNQIVASVGTPALTARVRELVEADGAAWFGPTRWQGRDGIRLSVSSWATGEEDIEITLQAMARALERARGEAAEPRRT